MIPIENFYSAVILTVADRLADLGIPYRAIIEWEASVCGGEGIVAMERKYQADPDDVRPIVLKIAEAIASVEAEKRRAA